MLSDAVSFLGILVALGALIAMAYRGWSVLFLAPALAMIAASFSGYPMLASWTQIFMVGRRLPRPIFPAVPARRDLRQADERQRISA
ncbi:hypothetical protein ACFSUK_29350 [Sphingobium scionense]